MQKIVKILEKNVEWLAVALGAGFFFYMIYLYAFQKPVITTIGGAPVTPGDVDAKTFEGPARMLQTQMTSQTALKMTLRDFVADLRDRLDPQGTATAMATPWSAEPLPASVVQAPPAITQLQQVAVTELPKAAAPDSLQFSQGRSNVTVPPPGVPGAPGGGQPAAGVGQAMDKNWVTVAGIIHTAPLAAEFARVKIPPQLSQTLILRVELVRQEQDENGVTWGPDQVVPPLSNVSLMPLPANDANQQAVQVPYRDWAEKDQKDLLQPDFYQVLQADPWTMPGVPPPVPVEAPFDPSTVTDPSTLTPDQKKQYDDYQDQQAKQKADQQRQLQQQRNQRPPGPGGGPGGVPGGYGGGGRGVADDSQRPLLLAQAVSPDRPLPPGPALQQPGGPAGAAVTGNNINPAMNNPSATLPTGEFDPSKQPDVVVWAHDDTAQPGKTYRYKLRYYLKNPVMQTKNVCNPQNLADQFYIVSADSAWTDQVTIKSETNFFVVAVRPGIAMTRVKFDIFRWKNGAWQMQTAEAGPGDMVGGVDPATGTDFTTGLTLVTVKQDPNRGEDQTILLTTDGGIIQSRDLAVDQNSPEHKKLKDQAAAALAPKTTAGP